MSTANPLLSEAPLPAFSAILPEHVEPAIDAILADYSTQIDALLASDAPRDFASVMLLQEQLEDRLSRAWSPVSHLHSVKDSETLRKAYTTALEKITEHSAELGQNRDLYAAVKAVADRADFAKLDRAAQRLTDDALRDFKLSGVALEEPARSRFKVIANELAKLGTEFEEAVLDATDAWGENIADVTALAGIPPSGLAVLRAYAEEEKIDGWRITLKQPSVQAVMTYADDRGLRERVYTAANTRASEQGPHAGRFDNTARIEQILALRHEAAQLLDFDNAAEESLATKMATTTQAVLEFLHDLVKRAKPVAENELTELRTFAASELGIGDLQPWDVAYASEKLRLQRFDLSEEELKPYFPLPAVMDGLFAITQRVFGVSLRAHSGVDVWHADVRFYDVLDAQGNVIAGAYVDLFARSAKRGGAWMDVCRTRFRNGASVQLPIAYLTCNFAPPTPDVPALLTHDDVITLFHEFGHGLHHLLKLPDELFVRMQAARHFQAALFLVRQLEFALFDFRLHLEFDPARGAQVQELAREIRREVAVIQPPSWQRMAHSFTHIFSGGYSAGYYSYLWAEVLSADAFSRFEQAGVFDAATGAAFRRSILAVGGSRPALESFIEFRGREPDAEAFLRSYGLAA